MALLIGGRASAQPTDSQTPTGIQSIEADPLARKHVRGCPVDRNCESDLQRGLYEFELEAFPRGGSPWVEGKTAPGRTAADRRGIEPTDLRPDLPWLARLKMPDFPVRWDERVIKYLEFYKDDPRGRNIMGAWLRDMTKYEHLILPALRSAKLPDDLIYLCMIESSYDPHETSRAGAAGLWQFMRHGGRVYGLTIDRWVDERRDPARSTQAVLAYWADLHQRFGDWDLAMAAFNAGYAGVLRSIAKYNTNDFWQLVDFENALPWGSSIYVPKALAAAIVGHNRELFGYGGLEPAARIEWDDVNVPRSITLKVIARAAGVSEEAIAALNPHLIRKRTPPGQPGYLVHVPRGTAELFRARFVRMRAEWDTEDEYVVQHGERFEDIAMIHGLSRAKLAALNGIEHESEVAGGITLIVPRVSDETKRANHQRAMDDLYAGGHPAGAPGDKLIVAVPDATRTIRGKRRVFYRVVTGDTQYGVAKSFGVDRKDLAAWNGLDPEGYLHARMVLQVFVDKAFDAGGKGVKLLDENRLQVVTRNSPEHLDAAETRVGRVRLTYKAEKRESFAEIGKKYGLSDHDLARINRRPRTTTLEPGDECLVYQTVKK
ncbi:MAG TPA: LysM peptidoglycan-binding domain-containing protein [Kofleriaceae bacterium]|nr:LysM peptidoglycan-binding domain-containing protein [Kofleriaceae bacterium]